MPAFIVKVKELPKNVKIGIGVVAGLLAVLLVYFVFFSSSPGPQICSSTDPTRCFVAFKKATTWDDAKALCDSKYAGLASIHSMAEQKAATQACIGAGVSRSTNADDTGVAECAVSQRAPYS